MKNFFKYLIATILGVFIVQIIMFLIFIAMIAGLSSGGDKQVTVKPSSVLHLTFDYEIKDRTNDNPFAGFNFTSKFKPNNSLGLNDILKNLRKAAKDENIKGIYLDITSVQAGVGTIEEIREALLKFKESGKFIVAYSNYFTQSGYYLASVADTICLNPEGAVEWKGLRSEIMFFKGALEKLGVEPQIVRHGKFKSAIEPFILDKMSDANREQYMTFMGSIWNHMVKKISEKRKISVEQLNAMADSLTIGNAKDALDNKLIDRICYLDEMFVTLKNLSGTTEKYAELMALEEYKDVELEEKGDMPKDKVAVIFASGQIDMGKGDDETIGGDGLAETIREVREDSTIKSVVLRVNSPGGSALASEVIWREVILTQKVKPVIVSMGDVAASGGYYISCPADVIVANPTTITGSIGVFGVLWNGEKMLNEKLGITVDGVETNKAAGIGTMTRPLTAQERDYFQKSVENVYDVFIGHVSAGRKITKAEVDSVGQGRVWSGINAKEIKLIDEFGGLERAIEIAKEKAGIKTEARIVEFPEKLPFAEQLMKELQGSSSAALKNELGETYTYLVKIRNFRNIKGIQARIPYDIEIY